MAMHRLPTPYPYLVRLWYLPARYPRAPAQRHAASGIAFVRMGVWYPTPGPHLRRDSCTEATLTPLQGFTRETGRSLLCECPALPV